MRAGKGRVSHQSSQRAFQFADVRLNRSRDVFSDVIRQREAIVLRFLLQNSDFCFQVGRLDIRDQSPFKTGAQSFLNGVDVFRQAIRGNNNLLLLLVKRVEGVEKLFLSALFAGDELDIVNQQHINRVETIAEGDHAVEAK